MELTDYSAYYDLESYLFKTVHDQFASQGWLNSFDFFCIVIWKANRAKTKIAKRIRQLGNGDLDKGVHDFTSAIARAATAQEKLSVLLEHGFLLPMATAILTVLYPNEFTMYDVRVCDALGDFHRLANLTKLSTIWAEYTRFVQSVKAATPAQLSLRDKDRYLWAKSFAQQLTHDVEREFL